MTNRTSGKEGISPAVTMLEAVINPSDLSVAGIRVIVDLSRPSETGPAFTEALREHLNLSYREQDPSVFHAATRVFKDGLTITKASQESAEVLKSARIAAKRIVTLLDSEFEATYCGLSEIER